MPTEEKLAFVYQKKSDICPENRHILLDIIRLFCGDFSGYCLPDTGSRPRTVAGILIAQSIAVKIGLSLPGYASQDQHPTNQTSIRISASNINIDVDPEQQTKTLISSSLF